MKDTASDATRKMAGAAMKRSLDPAGAAPAAPVRAAAKKKKPAAKKAPRGKTAPRD
jgi:hypothetical protein